MTDYEYVSLVLNLDRVETRAAVVVARGVGAASGMDDLDRSWADAVAIDESQVDELLFKANAERMAARMRRKLGWE